MPQLPPKRPKAPDKDIDKYVKKAWDAGWRCVLRRSNYIQCYPPDGGEPVTVKCTPSEGRYLKNLRGAFKRAGLDL
jgi:hypothetical protein